MKNTINWIPVEVKILESETIPEIDSSMAKLNFHSNPYFDVDIINSNNMIPVVIDIPEFPQENKNEPKKDIQDINPYEQAIRFPNNKSPDTDASSLHNNGLVNPVVPFSCKILIPSIYELSHEAVPSIIFDISCIQCIKDEFNSLIDSIPSPTRNESIKNVQVTFYQLKAVGCINFTASIVAVNPKNNSSASFCCHSTVYVNNLICLSTSKLECPDFNKTSVQKLVVKPVNYYEEESSNLEKIYTIYGEFILPYYK